MSAAVAILVLCWAILGALCLPRLASPPPVLAASWCALGFASILVAAREESWPLGEWSQDLTPVPVFTAIALATVALERLRASGLEWAALRHGIEPGVREQARPWYLAAAGSGALAVALLGSSGLALVIAAAMCAALAGSYCSDLPSVAR